MCTSLEFNEFFGSSFRRSLLCFLVFRCSIFKVPFATALCDSLFSISHSVPFVKGFLNFFQVSFRHFRPPQVTLPCSSSLSSCLSAPSGTGSLAELYYITTFLSFCQPLFSSFFTFFPFLFDVSPFFTPFSSFFPPYFGFLRGFFVSFSSLWIGFFKRVGFWLLFCGAPLAPKAPKVRFSCSFCFCKNNQKNVFFCYFFACTKK